MARTKASVGAKISSGKSSKARCCVAPVSSSGGSSAGPSKLSSGSGNPVCPRETPKWQRPITNFFIGNSAPRDDDGYKSKDDESPEKPSKKKKTRIIESDDEAENGETSPKNGELDNSTTLLPLDGESSHKIEEFYPKNGKGKGIGKKTTNKENVDVNVKRDSTKRDLEEIDISDEPAQCSKRVKL